MKKLLALAAALTLLTACGSSGNDTEKAGSSESAGQTASAGESGDESTAEEQEEVPPEETVKAEEVSAQLLEKYPVNDGAYDVSQGASVNMLGRSVLYTGNTARLAAKLENAVNNNGAAKLCFLGDSITAGSGAAAPSKAYVNLTKLWWEENIGPDLELTNAGIGATDSYLGVHRADRDAVPSQADIYVIEFINDQDNEFYQQTMDSLVKKLLSQPGDPAVIILEPSTEGGGSPQSVHFKAAVKYDIPMISFHDAVIPEIDAGNFTWKDISPDNVHPNNDGHVIMSQLITGFFQDIIDGLADADKEIPAFDPAAFDSPYENAQLANRDSDCVTVKDEGTFTGAAEFQSYFQNGWSSESGGSVTFEIKCRNLGLLYEKNTSGKFGTVAVKVDDESAVLIDGNFPGGWGNYAKADSIYSSDEEAVHTVKVEFIDDEMPKFNIFSWLVS
ncbi:MAG: SGNH/GDSL hydrolase family protein [Ruminococcus sp.]|nr:SGNH/GDSL hydrolase family protein [Ruminococcus sp.]